MPPHANDSSTVTVIVAIISIAVIVGMGLVEFDLLPGRISPLGEGSGALSSVDFE